ncbi:Uncharacterised protein [Mycobacteroides abscessus subsp. abscessus]|nr:Uncharacterised protein [Mycobacteroides abscessus subsp. abscessus]
MCAAAGSVGVWARHISSLLLTCAIWAMIPSCASSTRPFISGSATEHRRSSLGRLHIWPGTFPARCSSINSPRSPIPTGMRRSPSRRRNSSRRPWVRPVSATTRVSWSTTRRTGSTAACRRGLTRASPSTVANQLIRQLNSQRSGARSASRPPTRWSPTSTTRPCY